MPGAVLRSVLLLLCTLVHWRLPLLLLLLLLPLLLLPLLPLPPLLRLVLLWPGGRIVSSGFLLVQQRTHFLFVYSSAAPSCQAGSRPSRKPSATLATLQHTPPETQADML